MEWKPIKGTNRLYWVSEYGNIYMYSYCKMYNTPNVKVKRRLFKEKELNYNLAGLGYKTVSILGKSNYVHRLVAEAFLDTEKNQCVNHIDGDKLNNHYSNLEWLTYKQNSEHASSTGLINKHSEKRKKQASVNAKKGALKTRTRKHLKNIYEMDYKTNSVVNIYETIYEIDKRAWHVENSRNRAVQRLEFGEVKRSGKIKTYFLWEEDYNKYKNKLHDN